MISLGSVIAKNDCEHTIPHPRLAAFVNVRGKLSREPQRTFGYLINIFYSNPVLASVVLGWNAPVAHVWLNRHDIHARQASAVAQRHGTGAIFHFAISTRSNCREFRIKTA